MGHYTLIEGDDVRTGATAVLPHGGNLFQERVPAGPVAELPNELVSPLFQAAIEATEETIYNALFMAATVTGYQGRTVHALPVERVVELIVG